MSTRIKPTFSEQKAMNLYDLFESIPIMDEDQGTQDRFTPKKMLQKTIQGYTGVFWDGQDGQYRCIKAAMKILVDSGRCLSGERVAESFVRERDLLKKLSSMPDCPASICKCIIDWECKILSYYAMEFCSSGSLLDFNNYFLHRETSLNPCPQLLRHMGRYPWKILLNEWIYPRLNVIARVAYQIVSALQWLHSKSIVHFDLSLENILWSNDDFEYPTIKIIDFGLAYDFSGVPKTRWNGRMAWLYDKRVGKKEYMSPEIRQNSAWEVQNRGFRLKYDAESADVYSVGSILYMLIRHDYPRKDVRRWAYEGHFQEWLRQTHLATFFTEHAFDLVERLWRPESTRITINELFEHPFIRMGRESILRRKKKGSMKMDLDGTMNEMDEGCSQDCYLIRKETLILSSDDDDDEMNENDPDCPTVPAFHFESGIMDIDTPLVRQATIQDERMNE